MSLFFVTRVFVQPPTLDPDAEGDWLWDAEDTFILDDGDHGECHHYWFVEADGTEEAISKVKQWNKAASATPKRDAARAEMARLREAAEAAADFIDAVAGGDEFDHGEAGTIVRSIGAALEGAADTPGQKRECVGCGWTNGAHADTCPHPAYLTAAGTKPEACRTCRDDTEDDDQARARIEALEEANGKNQNEE